MKKIITIPTFIFLANLLLVSCNFQKNKSIQTPIFATAKMETEPIAAMAGEDAADDPAIWVNPCNKANSAIIGTNKKGGLAVYNLQGKQIHYYPVGKVNNVDVVHNFAMNDDLVDLVGASNRTSNDVSLFIINKNDRSLSPVPTVIDSIHINEVYGFCFYRSPKSGQFYAFVNGKDGELTQLELVANKSEILLKRVRSFDVGSQVEGMVADRLTGDLYIAEETVGIWKYGAEPEDGNARVKVNMSGEENSAIVYDVEGLTIYYAAEGKGYLMASSQGNNTYAIFERSGENKYLFSFRLGKGITDAVEETDGIDVINVPLGPDYPFGIFVAQDGFNKDENGNDAPQNFKIVPWEQIARLVNPNLIKDNSFDLYCPPH